MLPSIHRLDSQTSKSMHAGLLYPSLTSIICALARRSLQAQQVSHISIHINFGPEWQVSCQDDGKTHRTSQDLFWKEVEASQLFFLAYLGVLDVQQGLRKHIQSGDTTIFSGLATGGLTGGDAPTTSIIIRDIFRNLPVRRKMFSNQDTIRSELDHCRKDLALLSISYPLIHLTFNATTNEEQRDAKILETPKAGSMTLRYEHLFLLPANDPNFATIIDTSFVSKDIMVTVKGFIVKTLLASRSHQHVIINGMIDKSEDRRASQESLASTILLKPIVRDLLQENLLVGEKSRIGDIESGRYYGFYLTFDTGNAELVDRDLRPGIKKVLQDVFDSQDADESEQYERSILQPSFLEQGSTKRARPDRGAEVSEIVSKQHSKTIQLDRSYLRREPGARVGETAPEWLRTTLSNYIQDQSLNFIKETRIPDLQQKLANRNLDQNRSVDSLDRDGLSRGYVVGQVDTKYICINTQDQTLILIDQHAAHERVRLEAILSDYVDACLQQRISSEDSEFHLYGCVSIENDVSAVFEQETVKRALQFWGFLYRQEKSALKRKIIFFVVPAMLSTKLRQEEVLHTLITDLAVHYGQDDGYAGLRRLEAAIASIEQGIVSRAKWLLALRYLPAPILNLFSSLSCRGAIMFNDPLSFSQCETLVLQLAETTFPFQCAHGRPTLMPICKFLKDGDNSSPLPINWKALAI